VEEAFGQVLHEAQALGHAHLLLLAQLPSGGVVELGWLSVLLGGVTFTFRALGRHFYPKRLTIYLKSTFVEGDSNILLWYIKIRIEQVSSIHNCKANGTSFIIARLPA